MPNCTGAGFNLSHDWKCQVFGTSIRARARGFVLTGNARPVPGGLGPYSDPKTRLRRASLSLFCSIPSSRCIKTTPLLGYQKREWTSPMGDTSV